jgi:hypothetical protein
MNYTDSDLGCTLPYRSAALVALLNGTRSELLNKEVTATDNSNVFRYPKSSIQDRCHGPNRDWITTTKDSCRARVKVDDPHGRPVSSVGGRHVGFISAYDVFGIHWNAMAGERSLVPLKPPQRPAHLSSADVCNVSISDYAHRLVT